MNQTKSMRIELADVLRGIAILGIVILHSMEHYNFYRFPEVSGFVQFASTAAWDGTFFVFAGKWWLSTHRQGPMEWMWKKVTWINNSK